MEAFRLSREKFSEPLSGKGAALKGARWNSVGVELIYLASNRSLAMAEVAVHLTMATIPGDYVMVTVYIPNDTSIQKLNNADLPAGWNSFPHPASTQVIGDRLITQNRYCVLQVPSAVTQGDHNLLINPHHEDFRGIKIIAKVKFPFDKRIFK